MVRRNRCSQKGHLRPIITPSTWTFRSLTTVAGFMRGMQQQKSTPYSQHKRSHGRPCRIRPSTKHIIGVSTSKERAAIAATDHKADTRHRVHASWTRLAIRAIFLMKIVVLVCFVCRAIPPLCCGLIYNNARFSENRLELLNSIDLCMDLHR